MKKQTQCVHAGTIADPRFRGVNTPLYSSTAYNYMDCEAILYPRYFSTPNQQAVVDKVCALEGAESGLVFSSGMAAMSTAILAFVHPGDHVILLDDLYGGTHSLATDDFPRMGIEFDFVDAKPEAFPQALRSNTKMVVIESPTNPLLTVLDIRAVADFARKNNLISIIDNTFATPINQTPMALGMDIVVHSGTKYMGGHSDICCGLALAGKEKTRAMKTLAKHLGGNLDSAACHLLERSIKTLALRVERQNHNAMAVARFLEAQPLVRKVNYPGLPGFPGHEIAKRQMTGFGAMLSFELNEEGVTVDAFLRKLALIKPAVSLGGVESTICAPKDTSHAPMTPAERARVGISDSLLRLSVGIEHEEDLMGDIQQALEQNK